MADRKTKDSELQSELSALTFLVNAIHAITCVCVCETFHANVMELYNLPPTNTYTDRIKYATSSFDSAEKKVPFKVCNLF
jgi:hypothetical protein